ncbi:putative ribonuclease H-like domain-containing protein [Tanacetum coccineum]
MQKTILKQNYENFAASSQEGLDKTYDMFQSLSVNNEIHGQRLNATTAIGEVILLENAGHQGIRRIEIEMLQEGMHQEHQHKCLGYQDGIGGYDWSFQAEEGITNFALMAYTSQVSSSSNSKYDVQVKDISIQALQIIEEALKEKDDLKLKLEKFEESSKNLTKLIDSQLKSDVDDNPVNDRFKTGEGFHAVPPPYTRNYMPSRPDLSFAGLDDSVYKTKCYSKKAASISTTRPVNTVAPKSKVNDALPTTYSYFKAYSPHAGFGDQQEILLTITPKTVGLYMLKFDIYDLQGRLNIYKRLMRGVISAFGGSPNGGIKDNVDTVPTQQYILPPLLYDSPQSLKDAVTDDAGKKTNEEPANEGERNGQEKEGGASNKEGDQNVQDFRAELDNLLVQQNQGYAVPSPPVNTARPSVNTANAFEEHLFERFSPFKNAFSLPPVPNISSMDNTGIFGNAYDDEDVEEEVDMNNVNSSYTVPDTSFTKFHKDHPEDQVIGSLKTPVQTRHMTKTTEEHGLISSVHQLRRTNHKDFQNCLFACFLSQKEPKKVLQALEDPSWVEAMQNELLQFKLLNVWSLVDLPRDKWAIGTKWVFRNKKDERGIVVKNKARLVAQGHTQEEGIDYDEVFAPVARIEAIRLFLAYASFKDFVVYQMDVKSAFLYGKIEEEVYVCQPPRFEDPHFPNKVYKVEKALYGLHQAPRAWYETLSTYLLDNGFHRGQIDKTLFIRRHKDDILLVQVYVDDIIFGSTKKEMSTEFEKLMHDKFQMSSMGELSFFLGLQVKQKSDGIFISQDKYVAEILKKFDLASIKTASTPMETNKPLTKDEEAENVDVHLYRSMIGSLMYLTASRPDIMFAVCACARFQVTPKTSHLHAVKRIFRYLKGQPKLGLWYPRDSPFDLEAFSDSDYAGASLDRKSTTGGCQFLGKRLISWQCKKQTIVANSTTEAEYVAAANCCGQVLWIQNQMLDYGYNLMNTNIYIDNESTICIVKNPVSHSKTKHIEIRYHFIRDSYEKKLIQVIKIHTDKNVADLLTKAFDVSRMSTLKIWYCIKRRLQIVMKRRCDINHKWVGDEAVHKELGDKMERAATTASSSKAEQDSGSGPKCQDIILGDVNAQTRFETTFEQSNDPPLSKVNTFGSGEDSMKILELMEIVHNCLHCYLWDEIEVNAGSSNLLLLVSVNAARHQLLLLVQVPAAEGDSINTSIKGFTYFFIRFHSFKHSLNISPNSISSLIIKIIIMSSPKFAETHNVVAFLEKPAESDGFAEIIDFLKASSVSYALTVNPIIYTSCIQQFWATAQVKMVNGVHQLQSLIDKKKVIIMEASIRNDLHLDDAEDLSTILLSPLSDLMVHDKRGLLDKYLEDHMGAKDCCLMGLRKKRCGANWNEGGLSKEGYGARWKLMKVVLGVVVAAAEVGQQGHHVASFETKKWS